MVVLVVFKKIVVTNYVVVVSRHVVSIALNPKDDTKVHQNRKLLSPGARKATHTVILRFIESPDPSRVSGLGIINPKP